MKAWTRRAFVRWAALAPVVGPATLKALPGRADVLTPELIDRAVARARAVPNLWPVTINGRLYYVVIRGGGEEFEYGTEGPPVPEALRAWTP